MKYLYSMKILLSEHQLRRLFENTEFTTKLDDDNDEIIKSYESSHWEWISEKVGDLAQLMGRPLDIVKYSLRKILDTINKQFNYNLKRIIVVNKENEAVGFLVWSDKTGQLDDLGDGHNYPVIIATAIAPEYRGKGLYNMMIQGSKLQKPYLVHLNNATSPMSFWNKQGCKIEKEIDNVNGIGKCF
jgi:hypothetical protein